MSLEHPFAQYIRILGRGPRLSRSLTLDETWAAVGMILEGSVDPVQLGAFLCLLRARGETPDEVAGFAMAIRDALDLPATLPPVDLDWPSYAGKSRRLPLFILSALLLAGNGIRVAMHGGEGHTAGRLYARQALAGLGRRVPTTLGEAVEQLSARRFTYLSIELLHPRLRPLMDLKWLLGVRSPLHTALRHLNPLAAPASLISVFHPNYRLVHRDAARLMGMRDVACFKGEGGEVERRPEKPCLVEGLAQGEPFSLEWPPPLSDGPTAVPEGLDPQALATLWAGEASDPYGETTIIGTAALALHLCRRASSPTEAEAMARRFWEKRDRSMAALP